MAQALSKASAHVSKGDVAERHDRREYVPKSADRSLGGNEHGAQIRQKPPSPQAGRAEHRPAPAHAAGAPHRLGTFSFI